MNTNPITPCHQITEIQYIHKMAATPLKAHIQYPTGTHATPTHSIPGHTPATPHATPTYADALHHALVCSLHQLLAGIVHLAYKERLVQITMETIMIHCHINCRGHTHSNDELPQHYKLIDCYEVVVFRYFLPLTY